MTSIPWSANKNARQVYRELVDRWGFTYEGDTSNGHHVFTHPRGSMTLAHSPSAGHSWVKARRDEAAKITGKPFRGKRDTKAAKARAAEPIREQREAKRRAYDAAAERERAHQVQQRINENVNTIRVIRAGLTRLRTVEQRRYAERAIAQLVRDNQRLQADA